MVKFLVFLSVISSKVLCLTVCISLQSCKKSGHRFFCSDINSFLLYNLLSVTETFSVTETYFCDRNLSLEKSRL